MAKSKTKNDELDLTGWAEAQAEAKNLVTNFGTVKQRMQASEDAYFLEWKNKPKSPQVKSTISPAARIKVQGAVRLLTATSPKWEVPKEKNDPTAEQLSSRIEKFANSMWLKSNNIQQLRVEEDVALSAFLYDEIQARVISTLDLLDSIKTADADAQKGDGYDEAKWKNEIASAEVAAKRTPFLYEAINPKIGYYIKSRLGLEAHYTETELLVADILAQFGQRAQGVLSGAKSYTTKTVCEWWDKTYHYVWVVGANEPIVAGKHGLPIIPVVAVRVEGSTLFTKPEQQNEPFLYTVMESGLIERQNEMLTVLFTNMAALMDAQFVHTKGSDQANSIEVNHNVIGGVVEVEPGGTFGPMTKNIFDPSVQKGLQLVDDLFDESTLYAQALGERVGGSDNFSLVSLLSQAGRLPLVPTQQALQTAFAALMEISFKWLKHDGQNAKYDYGEISAEEIPARLEFTVKVEPDMPQDKLQQAAIADQLTKGPDPMVSKSWARTHILNEGQSDALQKEIWSEQASSFAFQSGVKDVVAGMLRMLAGMNQPTPTSPTGPTESVTQVPPDPSAANSMPPDQMQAGALPPKQPGMEATNAPNQ